MDIYPGTRASNTKEKDKRTYEKYICHNFQFIVNIFYMVGGFRLHKIISPLR